MQLKSVLFVSVSLLPFFGLAIPAGASPKPQASRSVAAAAAAGSGAASGGNATADPATGAPNVSDTQIANAVASWQNDTGKVTKFLNTATSFTGDEYTRQATIALNAEIDELNHKKILDAALGQQQSVQEANAVLDTQGNFQAVVDTLQAMVSEGPDTAQAQVNVINNNRCVNVLPNIDKYFAAAGSPTVTAVRPTGCLEVEGAPTAIPGAAPVEAPAAAPAQGNAQQDAVPAGGAATPITSAAGAEGTPASGSATGKASSAAKGTAAAKSSAAGGAVAKSSAAGGAAAKSSAPASGASAKKTASAAAKSAATPAKKSASAAGAASAAKAAPSAA